LLFHSWLGVSALLKRPLLLMSFGAALLGAGGSIAQDATADREMAERYFRAAQAGDDIAQFYLGALYAAGVGRTQSDAEAFQWIHRAAQRGHSHAMLVTSAFLAIGRGTQKDQISGYKWAYIVAEGSRAVDLKDGARQLLRMLEPKMTAEQIQRAKAEAYQFRALGNVPVQQTQPSEPRRDIVPPLPTTRPVTTAPAASQPESQKKGADVDIDALLNKVPPGLRNRFGL
jgi:TPR repeat protein